MKGTIAGARWRKEGRILGTAQCCVNSAEVHRPIGQGEHSLRLSLSAAGMLFLLLKCYGGWSEPTYQMNLGVRIYTIR